MPDANVIVLQEDNRKKLPEKLVRQLKFGELKTYVQKFDVPLGKFASKHSLLRVCRDNNLFLETQKPSKGSLSLPETKGHFRTRSGRIGELLANGEENGEEMVMINYSDSKPTDAGWRRRESISKLDKTTTPKRTKAPLMPRKLVYAMSFKDLKAYAHTIGLTDKKLLNKVQFYRAIDKAGMFPDPPSPIRRAKKTSKKKNKCRLPLVGHTRSPPFFFAWREELKIEVQVH